MAIIVPEDRQEDNSGGKRKDNRLTACDMKSSAYGGGTILFPGIPIYTMIWEAVTIRQVWEMISVAVCDDSIIECSRIAGKIKELLDETGVPCLIRQFNSGKELLQAQESFDIIFLDILMDGLDGMKTAELFRRENPDTVLVFVTSSRKYVFDAYEVEAFRYLLKPLEDGQLRKVLGLAVQKAEREVQDFLIVNKERQKKKLFLKDIYYFEIKGRLVYVHGKGEILAFYEQIGALEKSLLGRGFFRCHKSYLVNLKYVDVYNRQEIILDNGEKIILAKRRYEEFCQEFLKFMRTNGGISRLDRSRKFEISGACHRSKLL